MISQNFCPRFFKKKDNFYEAEHLYSPFYIRSVPFYVGLLAGVIVEKLKSKKIKLSKVIFYFHDEVVVRILEDLKSIIFSFSTWFTF